MDETGAAYRVALTRVAGEGFNFGRLLARVQALEARLTACPPSPERGAVVEHVKRAASAVEAGRVELAWHLIKAAERLELHLVTDATVAARLETLKAELPERLRPEAAAPIVALLSAVRDETGAFKPGLRETVIEALRLRDRYVDDLFAAKTRVQSRLKVLSACLFAALFCLAFTLIGFDGLLGAFLGLPAQQGVAEVASLGVVLLALLLGTIGACLSAMLSFTYLDQAPDAYEGLSVTAVRPLIGATSGLVALMLAASGLIDLGGDGLTLSFLALALGFSERLVLGTVRRLEARAGGAPPPVQDQRPA